MTWRCIMSKLFPDEIELVEAYTAKASCWEHKIEFVSTWIFFRLFPLEMKKFHSNNSDSNSLTVKKACRKAYIHYLCKKGYVMRGFNWTTFDEEPVRTRKECVLINALCLG